MTAAESRRIVSKSAFTVPNPTHSLAEERPVMTQTCCELGVGNVCKLCHAREPGPIRPCMIVCFCACACTFPQKPPLVCNCESCCCGCTVQDSHQCGRSELRLSGRCRQGRGLAPVLALVAAPTVEYWPPILCNQALRLCTPATVIVPVGCNAQGSMMRCVSLKAKWHK